MNKMTQCAPNGDWSQTSTLFVQGNQGGTKEGGPSRDSSFTSRRVASVSLLGTAIPSSEEARRTAPLKSPSSSLAETLPAKVSTGSRMNLPVRLLGADWTMVGSASSLISWLVCEAKLLRWPPLSGTRRQRAGKQNRRSQEDSEPSDETRSRISANFLADISREARGILFRIFTENLRSLKACTESAMSGMLPR